MSKKIVNSKVLNKDEKLFLLKFKENVIKFANQADLDWETVVRAKSEENARSMANKKFKPIKISLIDCFLNPLLTSCEEITNKY